MTNVMFLITVVVMTVAVHLTSKLIGVTTDEMYTRFIFVSVLYLIADKITKGSV